MTKDTKDTPPTANLKVASGLGALPREPKPQRVKELEFDQLPPSEQSDRGASKPAGSKPRSTTRRARRNNRYPTRRHDGAARHPKWKRANALKHGLYSGAVIIPGENSDQYQQLLTDLMEEYEPAGPTLRDEVVELANLMWKRRRLRRFIQSQLSAAMFNPRTPAFDEAWGLMSFTFYLRTEPETCFEQHAKAYLRADKIKHLQEAFPRSNYQSTSDWMEAVTKEIFSVLIPAISLQLDPPEPGKKAEEMVEALRQWKDDRQVAATVIQAADLLEYEVKEIQRLNAMIHKQTTHCAALKLWEEAQQARNKK